jgi:exopolysaccharide biosynthesis protein
MFKVYQDLINSTKSHCLDTMAFYNPIVLGEIMKTMKKKTLISTLTIALTMVFLNAYVLMDAFVLTQSYVTVDPIEGNTSGNSTGDVLITSSTYKDDKIEISIETVDEDGIVYYVVDIQLSNVTYLRTAFANNTFGRNISQTTSTMAENNEAILAINGDFYGFRDSGLIIRNGVLYRDAARSSPDNQALLIDELGNFTTITEGSINGDNLIAQGILQSFSFGPVLVKDGVVQSCATNFVSSKANPRTAIGMIEPLHYLWVIVDGRTSQSSGMTLKQLAQVFVERGATIAYNLDGGGSSTLWFNGEVINNPVDGSGSERKVSDIIYIGA